MQVKEITGTAVLLLGFASFGGAQTRPTQAEIDRWKKEPNILESSECKKITWLLENERTASSERPKQLLRNILGWWGRGFIEGAVLGMGGKAQGAANDFGLSVDVVAGHIATYCYQNPTKTPFDAVQQLLLKVVK
jgi:hypothetical protein